MATLAQSRKRIFESVFPPPTFSTLPTPVATPTSSFSILPPLTPSHGYNTRHHPTAVIPSPVPVALVSSPATVFAKESRAWHLATTYLSLPTIFPDSFEEWRGLIYTEPTKDALEAIRYLVANSGEITTPEGGMDSLLEWYTCEVRRHFLCHVRPGIDIPMEYSDDQRLLQEILDRLTTARSIYMHQLLTYLIPQHPRPKRKPKENAPGNGDEVEDVRVQNFVRSLNSIISYSLPDPAWNNLVYGVFLDLCRAIVTLPGNEETPGVEDGDSVADEDEDRSITVDGDEHIYDGQRLSQQSFATVTDLGRDTIAYDDGTEVISPEAMDGIDDFGAFKREAEERMRMTEEVEKKIGGEQIRSISKEKARKKMLSLWAAMEKLGIGGNGRRGERVFAEVINTLLTSYINTHFACVWDTPSKIGGELNKWVEDVLGRLVVDVLFPSKGPDALESWAAKLKKLSPRESFRLSRQSLDNRRKGAMDVDTGSYVGEEGNKRRKEDLESWKRIAIGRLGRLRVGELFDIVVEWPESLGGIEDLKSYVVSPQTRMHLATSFTAALSTRLLHPAAATSDILRAYISLIRAFTVLDPRGVLLDRVSRGIRRYLREREDTVRVIVRGIMSESLPACSEETEELSELSRELRKGAPAFQQGGLDELDYDDLTWSPDPVDAGPGFKRSKGLDVVGSLISLWESKDIWTKEIVAVLANKLLSSDEWVFEKEVRSIELLKLRFGESTMQGCDVMLKDITESRRSDTHILGPNNRFVPGYPEFHTKILSRLFWPAMKDDVFNVPPKIYELQRHYERAFETLKKKRKLTWIQTAGTVEVELELEDRVILVPDATTWQAAVIYEFSNDSGQDKWRIDQLAAHLNMDEALVKNALSFWSGKDVLRMDQKSGVYATVENLDDLKDEGTPAPPTDPIFEVEEVTEEKKRERAIVEQFVLGMLTNGGPLPLERVAVMLGLVPGGFSWGKDELREFLARMRAEGKLEYELGNWRIPKG